MTARATWTDWSCSVSVTVGEARRIDVAEQVVRHLMDEVDAAVSRFRPDSELERVNHDAGTFVPVSRLTLDLVTTALDAARTSEGAVDPTLGAELLQAGYDEDISFVRARRSGHLPTGRRSAAWQQVRTDPVLRRVGVPRGVRLDLGATAKAWTADEAARRIARRLGTAALVEIGGDVATSGRPRAPWRIDVAEVRGDVPVRVDLSHGAITTSSTLARRWTTADGRTAHHVLDPTTGRPVEGPWRSASVWAPTALRANTAGTAALVLGDRAVPWLRERGVDARLVGIDGGITHVGHWPSERVLAA